MTSKPVTKRELAGLFACLDGVAHAGLAVSGGADSVALMHLAHMWRAGRSGDAPEFTVLSVDHGLRPESAGEVRWVEKRARELGLPCAILHWRPGPRRGRVQADARQARYDLMAGYAHAHGIDALVTAHHLDDQAETLLMRLARGSGVDGLAGIPGRGHWAGLAVLRPLLDLPRARLVATLATRGAEWLDDPGNEDDRFERVRLRKALPELDALGIGADKLALSARRLRRAGEALEAAAGGFLQRHAGLDETGFCRIDAAALLDAPEEIALRALSRALRGVGGQLSAPRLAKLEALLDSVKDGAGAPVTLGGCRVSRAGKGILVVRETGRRGLGDLMLAPGESALWDNRYHVSLGAACASPVRVRALGGEGYGTVRARLGRAVTLPERAAEGLVSFWRENELFAVPPLGYCAPAAQGGVCAAEFVNRALFSATAGGTR